MSGPLCLKSLQALVFRCQIDTPVVTSFGTMRERPMVLVRAEDADGAVGWGEVWCNFPAVGAEHRARLVESVFAPLLQNRVFESAPQAFAWLTEKTAVLAIQSGEPGPIAQAIAGIDIALWDLAAHKAGQPLWRLLGGTSPRVRVYASGLNPDAPEELAAARAREGYRAFKLKVGFCEVRDVGNLRALRETLGPDVELMADANQAWSLDTAQEMSSKLAPFGLQWLEEPLRADRPWSEWRTLSSSSSIPLAAGENLTGEDFDVAIASGVLGVIQPDLAKWGGFSRCLPVARKIIEAGLRFCPHYLGGGVGLLASAHLLAAAGGNGLLEVDANHNPLRTLICGPLSRVADGAAMLAEKPGLGVVPDLETLHQCSVAPLRAST